MNAIDNFMHTMTASGCSPFFVTSALSTCAFGELGRRHQEEILDDNIEFKQKIALLKENYSEARLKEQLQFRRELYELGKKYQICMTRMYNENRKKEIEFKYVCDNWPLNIDIHTVMAWQRDLQTNSGFIPLRVLIANTDVTSYKKGNGSYEDFCTNFLKDRVPNTIVETAAWKRKSISSVAESMVINYIMQGIPTLLLYPYRLKDKYYLEYFTWSFANENAAFLHDKAITLPYSLERADAPEIMLSIQAVIGIVRDSYMVLVNQQPSYFIRNIPSQMLEIPEIKSFIVANYKSLYNTIMSSSQYRALCSETEIKRIESSFINKHSLLED